MGTLIKSGWTLLTTLAVVASVALLTLSPTWILGATLVLLLAWLGLTQVGRQAASLAWIGIATLPKRLGSSCVIVVGVAGVVGVLVALLAMGAGFEATFQQTGTDDTVIILHEGALDEISSVIDHDTVAAVSGAPQVLKTAHGDSITSAELVVVDSLPKKDSGQDASVQIRGVGEHVWDVRTRAKITAGRPFRLGLRELVVGRSIHEHFKDAEIGSIVNLTGKPWTLVGIFDSGDAHNSEIWGDAGVIAPAFHHGSTVASLTVRLTGAQAFDAFKAALMADPRLKVSVQTTRQYYTVQTESLSQMIHILGAVVGAVMALGAVFGALNTMYAAVATRTREIATLRAIGFSGVPVIASILLETLLLALIGGGLGAAIAWAFFDGYTASTMDVMFAFAVSPELLWEGLKWALAIGLIGGLFPAIRAARMLVTAGLREL